MNKKYNLLFLIALLTSSIAIKAQPNPDFTLASNGVTCLCPNANFGDTGTLTINGQQKTFTKRTRAELSAIIYDNIYDLRIAFTCTSGITNMRSLFSGENFNQNLEHWDVSNVTNMRYMFSNAENFNQPLGNWDVSNVTDMTNMFSNAENFNQPLDNWDVSNVTNMGAMFFATSAFNSDISAWDTSNVTDMQVMFYNSAFNKPLNNWDVSNVTNMNSMFENSSFNQPLNDWDVSSVTNMTRMFGGIPNNPNSFNQNLNSWDVSNVTDMSTMFYNSLFNQPLDNWDVSNASNMIAMFENAFTFNQDISSWCVEQITTKPRDFATGSPLQVNANFRPNWGAECTTLSIAENSLSSFKVYPNPAENKLNLSWSTTNFPGDMSIQVYSLNGKRVLSESYSQKPSELNVSQLASDVYLLKVNSGNQSAVRRIIKK